MNLTPECCSVHTHSVWLWPEAPKKRTPAAYAAAAISARVPFQMCIRDSYLSEELKAFSYEGLYRLIQGRKTDPKEGSYTTYLFEKGLDKILKKVGEECTEVIIGGRKEDREETIYEIADLTYHVMVLMVQMGITLEDVTAELEKRHVSLVVSSGNQSRYILSGSPLASGIQVIHRSCKGL